MSEFEMEYIEDEKNEMVIIIDSQDQEGFSAVEEIVNEENILIEGFLWDDRSILNEMSQIDQMMSNDSDSAREEETLVENTGEEYGDDDLEYVIINNLEEIELENKIANRDASGAEHLVEDGKEKCFEIVKVEEGPVACIPNQSVVIDTTKVVSSGVEKSCWPNHILRSARLEALVSKLLVSSQAQIFVSITYLKRVQEIVRKRFQRPKKHDRSVILGICKGRSSNRASSLKLPDITSHEGLIAKDNQVQGKEEQPGDLTPHGSLELERSPPELPNDAFELPLFNKITFGKGVGNLEQSTGEVVLIIEVEGPGESERENSTKGQIFEVFEELENLDDSLPEQAIACLETEVGLELDPNSEQSQYAGPLETAEDCRAGVPELEQVSEPKSDSNLVLLGSGESKNHLTAEPHHSVMEAEYKGSQDEGEFGENAPDCDSGLGEDEVVVLEVLESRLTSQSKVEEKISEDPELPPALIESFQGCLEENDSVEDEKSSSGSAKEGDGNGLTELVEESVHESAASQNKQQEKEGGVFRTDESPRLRSEEVFGPSIKASREPPDLPETASLEEMVGCNEAKKEPTRAEETGNGQTEVLEETSQKDSVGNNCPEDPRWTEARDGPDMLSHAKDGIIVAEHAAQDLRSKKEAGSSPLCRSIGASPHRKPPECFPYHSFQRKKKSFGVFNKLVSLAQGRGVARPISKDLSMESMRAIDIIKKARRPR